MNLIASPVTRVDTRTAAALVAEGDSASCDLLYRMLREVGYQVVTAADAPQLDAALRRRDLPAASSLLAVVRADLATRCAAILRSLGALRVHCGLAELNVVLTYEAGTLGAVAMPSLVPCNLLGAVEKPFDLEELKTLAQSAGPNALPAAIGRI